MNNEVKAELVRKDIKQIEIARKLQVSGAMISLVVSGKKKSERIRKVIASALDMRVEELWPESGKRKAA